MFKESNDTDLRKRGVNDKIIPFYQIWQELVSSKTLDVYQYRIMTVVSILDECLEVIDKTLQGTYINDSNLEPCKEEALEIINNDSIIEKFYCNEKYRLLYALGKRSKELDEKQRLKAQLSYLIKRIKPTYFDKAFSELKIAIDNGIIYDIEYYSNIIASQAVTKGWSPKALVEMLRYFTGEETVDEQLNRFRYNVLTNEKVTHDVLINLPFPKQNPEGIENAIEIFNRIGLDVESVEELTKKYDNVEDLATLLNAEKKYFRITVEAYDIYSAAHIALRGIAEKLNMVSFYNLLDSWNLSAVIIVSINCKSSYHRSFPASKLYQTYDYLDSSNKIFEDTRKIFMDEEKKEIREKLQGSFSYTNISRSSLFQEEKYMNLWVALESLSRTTMYSSIIANIKETVPAAETLRYVYRIVRNFVEDAGRCRVEICKKGVRIDYKQESKQNMVSEVIAALNNDSDYEDILERCKVNTLLFYRAKCIHELLTNTDFACSKIINHYNKVKWQIQRLYRIRNEIAHTALREQTSLIVYIEHLYDYLSKFIMEIVTCLVDKHQDTLEEAFSSIRDNYECFISISKDRYKDDLLKNVLDTGIISLL